MKEMELKMEGMELKMEGMELKMKGMTKDEMLAFSVEMMNKSKLNHNINSLIGEDGLVDIDRCIEYNDNTKLLSFYSSIIKHLQNEDNENLIQPRSSKTKPREYILTIYSINKDKTTRSTQAISGIKHKLKWSEVTLSVIKLMKEHFSSNNDLMTFVDDLSKRINSSQTFTTRYIRLINNILEKSNYRIVLDEMITKPK